MNTTDLFNTGDLVTPAPDAGWPERVIGKCYRIQKVPGGNRKKYQAEDVAGGRGITGPGWAFIAWEGEAATAEAIAEAAPPPVPALGTVVELQDHDGFYVVIGVARSGGGKVARLGGDDDRYFTNVNPRRMTVVELDLEGE